MARKSTRDEDDDDDFVADTDAWQEDAEDSDVSDNILASRVSKEDGLRHRDWRDLERYKEEQELRRLMEDDYLLDDDDFRSYRSQH